jgi:alpha-amylase
VSQSEGGFELVHQSVVVMPHWIVTPDADGVWKVAMRLSIGNLKAEQVGQPHRGPQAAQTGVVSAAR